MMTKKIAIFHNFMDNIGGAEFVALFLARGLNADIYTTNIDSEKIKKMGFSDVLPRIKSIGKVPIKAPFRHQLALWKFRRLNLGKEYGFYIIAGDWAVSGAVNNKPNLWYAHGPINELWEFKNFVRDNLLVWWKKPIYELWVLFNRYLTRKYSKRVDKLVCNSKNTKKRIKKYYKRSAEVIYPPVDCKKYDYKSEKGYWLSVNRLLNHKRVDLQLEAFSKMPDEKLIIVGSYEVGAEQFENYKRYLEGIMTSNVEVRSWITDSELVNLYNNSKGFIATAGNEDFGMTLVEAMAAGKPVIAGNEGGYKETVIDGKTGMLIEDIDAKKIISAVKKIGKNLSKYKVDCLKRAKEFDVDNFIKRIKKEVER